MNDMQEVIAKLKYLLTGRWTGEGSAKYPTIHTTGYTEQLEFAQDQYKDAIFFNQKTWYKNETPQNGHTVFWDTGFIYLKEGKIRLHSAQIGGRMEMYELVDSDDNTFTFNSTAILNDLHSVRSQRKFTVDNENLSYQLNMATHAADFQNHLSAHLIKSHLK